jgi:hypothetical protein
MNIKEQFPQEILPVYMLQVLTFNTDHSASCKVWSADPELVAKIISVLGEPHAESLIDAEHLQAGLDVSSPGMSIMYQEQP